MEFGELLKLFLLDLQSLFRTRIADRNFTLTQILLISSIPLEGLDMTSLARRLGVDNSTLTRLVNILVRNGWVIKQQNPKDKRSVLVSLTEEGESVQQKIEEKIDRFGQDIYLEIPMEDREEVKEILSSFHWIVSKSHLKH